MTKIIQYVKDFFNKEYSGHDYFHTMRVYKTAKEIALKENADIEIVSLVALLHDVDDFKLSKKTYKNKDNARKILSANNIAEDKIDLICQIIEEISFKGTDSVSPSSIEGKVVQDADRLDALGAIGIARAFAYGGNHNRIMHDPEILPKFDMNEEEYRNHISTTVNHFYEKLFYLKDMMNTTTGKEIANLRHEYMKDYINKFLAEWDGME